MHTYDVFMYIYVYYVLYVAQVSDVEVPKQGTPGGHFVSVAEQNQGSFNQPSLNRSN